MVPSEERAEMEKSAEAFRTISEVAEELDVPKHVLRFWEGKFAQVKPMKRGGGRRYYRPDDVELLRGIRRLLHEEGYTIKGVQKLIRQSSVDYVKQIAQRPAATSKRGAAKAPMPLARELAQALERVLAELEACQGLIASVV
jgi:DNA-binding transcriptional MerR regulator